jgi:hypothetical protein
MHSLREHLRRRPGRLLLAVLFAGLVSGCGIFSPDESTEGGGGGGGNEPYPLAFDENQLITNFIRAHEERNFIEYDKLLHDGFIFYFASEDIDRSPGGQGFWDRAADVASTDRMFNGKSGTKPDGSTQDPVQQITLRLEAVDGQWTTPTDPEFAGTRKRSYKVFMDVTYTNGDISRVTGEQQFFAAPVNIQQGEVTVTIYQLKFWRDTGKEI